MLKIERISRFPPLTLTARGDVFVAVVPAVVVEVTLPPFGDAASVAAPEVASRVAHGAVLLPLVRVVTAIVVPVAPREVRDAPVVRLTLPPAHRAGSWLWEGTKEGSVLFNDALNTFYLRLYGVGHMEEGRKCFI